MIPICCHSNMADENDAVATTVVGEEEEVKEGDDDEGRATPPYGVSRTNSSSSTIRASDQRPRQISRQTPNNHLLCCTAAKAVKRTYPIHY